LFELWIIVKNLQFILLFLNIWTLTFYCFRLKHAFYLFLGFRVSYNSQHNNDNNVVLAMTMPNSGQGWRHSALPFGSCIMSSTLTTWIIVKNLQFILLFLNIWTLTFYCFRLKHAFYLFLGFFTTIPPPSCFPQRLLEYYA
jgi:hypothetical protein